MCNILISAVTALITALITTIITYHKELKKDLHTKRTLIYPEMLNCLKDLKQEPLSMFNNAFQKRYFETKRQIELYGSDSVKVLVSDMFESIDAEIKAFDDLFCSYESILTDHLKKHDGEADDQIIQDNEDRYMEEHKVDEKALKQLIIDLESTIRSELQIG